jgi:hypothetical protein
VVFVIKRVRIKRVSFELFLHEHNPPLISVNFSSASPRR